MELIKKQSYFHFDINFQYDQLEIQLFILKTNINLMYYLPIF